MNLADKYNEESRRLTDIKPGDIVTIIGFTDDIEHDVRDIVNLNEKYEVASIDHPDKSCSRCGPIRRNLCPTNRLSINLIRKAKRDEYGSTFGTCYFILGDKYGRKLIG